MAHRHAGRALQFLAQLAQNQVRPRFQQRPDLRPIYTARATMSALQCTLHRTASPVRGRHLLRPRNAYTEPLSQLAQRPLTRRISRHSRDRPKTGWIPGKRSRPISSATSRRSSGGRSGRECLSTGISMIEWARSTPPRGARRVDAQPHLNTVRQWERRPVTPFHNSWGRCQTHSDIELRSPIAVGDCSSRSPR